MAAYSTIDALSTLCTSVPDWNIRLDELQGQIAQRQIELARLDEEREDRPTARSLRNKGSTESLRPKDVIEDPFPPAEVDECKSNPIAESPKQMQNGFTPHHTTSATAVQPAAAVTPPPSNCNPPKASPAAALTRQSSQPTPPTQPRIATAVLKKRKTESLASGESIVPKYRTRSMIIVYYDSTVQTAFEELVKFVSGSRNAMRKGKMAAKMAEMRRAAELEIAADEDADGELLNNVVTGSGFLLGTQRNVAVGKAGESLVPCAAGSDGAADYTMPRLRYMSTRNMGPSRDYGRGDNFASTLSMGLLRGYRKSGGDGSAPDVFDNLDKGLEWCQSQCEHAAHQFLRDGECSQEIENIKRKLVEVKENAEKEVERLKKEEADAPPKPVRNAVPEKGKTRELKSVQMRKELGTMKDLEVDDMEVDEDEGIDDMEPPKLIFKRSRDLSV
jgi:hypothetical protein